jgi:hypothetical protein
MLSNFYYSGNSIFTNKLDGIKYCADNNKKLNFYYHDSVYDSINWKVEPPNSLDFYYKEQAQRIRDTYDYVVLFYSGGIDSSNILETFHFNKIKLDKIVCVGAFKQDSNSGVDENHNGELYHQAFPYLKELGLDSITQICDYSDYFNNIKSFSVYEYGEEWVNHVGTHYSPHHWFWRDIEKHVVPANMETKRVALIWGKDKTSLSKQYGVPGFSFKDRPCLGYGNTCVTKKLNNVDRINFYWDPGYTNIVVKQLHVLNNFKHYMLPDTALYDLKKPILFKSPKSPNVFLSLRDQFLLNHTTSPIFDFYKVGIKKIMSKIHLNDDCVIPSKFYPIV